MFMSQGVLVEILGFVIFFFFYPSLFSCYVSARLFFFPRDKDDLMSYI